MSKEKMKNSEEAETEIGLDSDEVIKDESREENQSRDDEELTQLVLDQQKQLEELEKQVEELRQSNLRKTAELDNMKKRMQRDRAQIYESAKAAAIEQFLPVNDDLKRTLKVIEESGKTSESGVEDAVKMIFNKIQDVLQHYDVQLIDQTGIPFNVNLHDALIRQKPEDDNVESDTVMEILENGYRMGDRTIRHAKVIVSE
jgi:molecular chaperone GrpE